jgi:hypothetical protein
LIERAIVEDSRLLKGYLIAFNNAGQQPLEAHNISGVDMILLQAVDSETGALYSFLLKIYAQI